MKNNNGQASMRFPEGLLEFTFLDKNGRTFHVVIARDERSALLALRRRGFNLHQTPVFHPWN